MIEEAKSASFTTANLREELRILCLSGKPFLLIPSTEKSLERRSNIDWKIFINFNLFIHPDHTSSDKDIFEDIFKYHY
ncbi:hypothetical protein Avbf_13874 [Armadillidium vulgare]|nr:hypothetical protein Avbf_13874 [Armadillidium vulgare]